MPMYLWVFSLYILDVCAVDKVQFNSLQFNWIFFVLLDCFSIDSIRSDAIQLRLCFCLSAFNSAFRLWDSCSPPSGAPRDFSLGFSSGVWAFLRAPFLGFLRRFVGLAHVIFYHVFWPRSLCFRYIVLSIYLRDFLRLLVWLPLRLGDRLQSAFVPVKLRDPHFLDQPVNVRRGWACLSGSRHLLRQRWWFFGLFFRLCSSADSSG